ncbi:argininosuccinate synthase, partial [bacterium]|nr:argininosuccinate synthase [bacterium]
NDGNMAGETFEAGDLENLWIDLPEGMFKLTVNPWDAPNISCDIVIQFENGIPVAINGLAKSPIEIIESLNQIGGLNGVGRYSMVEDRRVGMKSRGEYEEPALHILWKAHHALEALVLDKDFIRMKEELSPKFAQMVYDGKWFCPTMQTMQMIGLQHQQYVPGKIRLQLYKGNIAVTGWDSPYSLYSTEINSMDIDDPTRYNQTDAIGFIRISALSILVQANQGRNLRHK